MFFNRILSIGSIVMFFCLIWAAITHAAQDYRIGLQDQISRTVVYCYTNSHYTAEECATYFENQGYVRLRDIPQKPASYDFLTVDTYPTRRWRAGELTPRW